MLGVGQLEWKGLNGVDVRKYLGLRDPFFRVVLKVNVDSDVQF